MINELNRGYPLRRADPPQAVGYDKRSDKQIDRARLLEVRIHLPPADTTGTQVQSSVLGGGLPGELDNSSINSQGLGGALQGTWTQPLFDHDNHLIFGASIDHATVNFNSTSELGIIDPNTLDAPHAADDFRDLPR